MLGWRDCDCDDDTTLHTSRFVFGWHKGEEEIWLGFSFHSHCVSGSIKRCVRVQFSREREMMMMMMMDERERERERETRLGIVNLFIHPDPSNTNTQKTHPNIMCGHRGGDEVGLRNLLAAGD